MTMPNYRMYSIEQLKEALYHVDKDKFPERVKTIKHYLKNPGPRGNVNKANTISIGKKSEVVLIGLSTEIVFWLALSGLGLLGYLVC